MSLAEILDGARKYCESFPASNSESMAKIDGYLLTVGVNLARDLEPGYEKFKQGYIDLVQQYSSYERLSEAGKLVGATGFDWELFCRTIYGFNGPKGE